MIDYSKIADEIAGRGWSAFDGLLDDRLIASLAREARRLWEAGVFKQAGVGRRASLSVRESIRGDYILWLDETDLTKAQSLYWLEMGNLRRELNEALFAGLVELEAHLSVYPAGTFYRKHVDRFSTNDARVISCSLYLNQEWKREDGGELRVYEGPEDEAGFATIYPTAATVVLMNSASVYHEVRPASKERFSITGWFKRRQLSEPHG